MEEKVAQGLQVTAERNNMILGIDAVYFITVLLIIVIALIISYIVILLMRYVEQRVARARELKALLYSMARAMTEAVDARTPYNASHTRNVAKYSVELAKYVRKQNKAKRTTKNISDKDLEQLELAALLHDVGKLDVSVSILDKPTRLGHRESGLYEKLNGIKLRYELDYVKGHISEEEYKKEVEYIDRAVAVIREVNKGVVLSDETKHFIEDLGKRAYKSAVYELPYLTGEEYNCLLITKGTLTEDEKSLMHEHVVFTEKILGHVCFNSDYDKVASIASNHHEFLDGSGYPKRLKGDQLDVATRILTISDIYDALTAEDRPYRKAKSKEEAVEILREMAQAGKLDAELVELAGEIWIK